MSSSKKARKAGVGQRKLSVNGSTGFGSPRQGAERVTNPVRELRVRWRQPEPLEDVLVPLGWAPEGFLDLDPVSRFVEATRNALYELELLAGMAALAYEAALRHLQSGSADWFEDRLATTPGSLAMHLERLQRWLELARGDSAEPRKWLAGRVMPTGIAFGWATYSSAHVAVIETANRVTFKAYLICCPGEVKFLDGSPVKPNRAEHERVVRTLIKSDWKIWECPRRVFGGMGGQDHEGAQSMLEEVPRLKAILEGEERLLREQFVVPAESLSTHQARPATDSDAGHHLADHAGLSPKQQQILIQIENARVLDGISTEEIQKLIDSKYPSGDCGHALSALKGSKYLGHKRGKGYYLLPRAQAFLKARAALDARLSE